MKRHRWQLLTLLLALLLAAVAAGCGGDDDEEGAGDETTAATTEEEAAEDVSGSVNVLAVWTGAEGESFQAVVDGFKEKYPNVNVTYKSAKEPATVLSTAVEGGNPPDLAALPQPGFMRDFAERNALKPVDFMRDTLEENYAQAWIDLGTVDGKLYGVFFKASNKSLVWYNVPAFEDAGIEPPETWDAFLENAKTLNESGVPAYSLGGSDGWTLTDLFENIYLKSAGADKYRQLQEHELKWTDASVVDALTEMGKIFSDKENVAGGASGALQTDFPTSVTQVFQDPPKAAQVSEGDFVGGVITTETQAKPGTDFDVYPFPSIGDAGGNAVMGSGDVVVMFKDNPAARALLEYLATPEAQEIWAKRGGFAAPSKNVSTDVYPDEIQQKAAGALTQADEFVFDLSDLQPGTFGSDSMFTILQDFLQKPDDVQGTAQKLEAAAAKAYKSS